MIEIGKVTGLRGELEVPGDKSISHRSIMLGSIAEGKTEIRNFLLGADCLATMNCFSRMGIQIDQEESKITVHGKGINGLRAPSDILNVGNSGTTARLMAGILVGQRFDSKLSGDESLNSRPMKRIIEPLTLMGAHIQSMLRNQCAPLFISPGALKGIFYHSPVASAQVKSSILLAGLYAEGETTVTEPALSRNHTEIMLKAFGADIVSVRPKLKSPILTSTRHPTPLPSTATINPGFTLYGQNIHVPGDISSAAYFIAAGLIVPDSEIVVKNVGVNPTRAGFLEVCERMGGSIVRMNERVIAGEPIADIFVKTSQLHGMIIEGDIIPTLIDEIPIIAVMAAVADGVTVIRDAAELRVKETDRIETTTEGLIDMGANVKPTNDGLIIYGGNPLKGATIHTLLDHRIAMAFTIAAMVAEDTTKILDHHCVDVSFPNFYELFENLL